MTFCWNLGERGAARRSVTQAPLNNLAPARPLALHIAWRAEFPLGPQTLHSADCVFSSAQVEERRPELKFPLRCVLPAWRCAAGEIARRAVAFVCRQMFYMGASQGKI